MNPASLFLNPAMLALAALLPVIVLLYLLKLKRRPLTVPSTLLWRRAVEDLVANSPFQKLRNNLLMWLQLLALLLLVLALARPVMQLAAPGGESIILLLDVSASMQTREEDGRTRLDHAKDLALEAVDAMGTGNRLLGTVGARDEMMIIGVANRPIPLQTMTSDQALLRAAIRNARPTDATADLRDAARILEEKTRISTPGDEFFMVPNPNARVILISDGVLGPSREILAEIPFLDYVNVGSTDDNVGITAVDVRESYSGTFEYEVFASLVNAAEEERDVFLELVLEGEVLDVKRVSLPAGGDGSAVFLVGEDVRGTAVVRLANHTDSFPRDDIAHVVVAPSTEISILLVSRGNPFLENVLTVDPRARVSVIRPENYHGNVDYDIVLFDRHQPEEIPSGNLVFINSIPPGHGYTAGGAMIENPVIIDWNRVHPLTPQYLNFEGIAIAEMMDVTAPEGAALLVEADRGELISHLETESRRMVVIGFDITRSYWPINASFPVFFSNLLDQWARNRAGAVEASYATGSTISLLPPREATEAVIRTPGGQRIAQPLEGQRSLHLTDTIEAGLYTLSYDTGWENLLAVNLASAQESRLAPARDLELPGGRVIEGSAGDIRTTREIWYWLALLALGVLTVEWLIYTRRSYM